MINFKKLPGVNYDEYFGPRPAIVFVDKVYVPDPEENHEHPMTVYDLDEVRKASNTGNIIFVCFILLSI